MAKECYVLTIIGSPHDGSSNTRTFVNDFLDDVEAAGLTLKRRTISLGKMDLSPCKGCWNCTKHKPCPINDDLDELKKAMIGCDLLILGSPVYTNQVTAQMKTMFDRLFTWCHVFPLLGKYALSAVTTGNDGYKETGNFLEKMLATYGVSSFGTLVGTGAFTSGFWPRRNSERAKNLKMAAKVASTIGKGRSLAPTSWNKKMITTMRKKLMGVHTIHYIAHGHQEHRPDPPKFFVKLLSSMQQKRGVTDEQVKKLAGLMTFELDWWTDRGWLGTKSFTELRSIPVPRGFNAAERLL